MRGCVAPCPLNLRSMHAANNGHAFILASMSAVKDMQCAMSGSPADLSTETSRRHGKASGCTSCSLEQVLRPSSAGCSATTCRHSSCVSDGICRSVANCSRGVSLPCNRRRFILLAMHLEHNTHQTPIRFLQDFFFLLGVMMPFIFCPFIPALGSPWSLSSYFKRRLYFVAWNDSLRQYHCPSPPSSSSYFFTPIYCRRGPVSRRHKNR